MTFDDDNGGYASLMDFFFTVGSLKRLKRQGWVNNKINAPESVADHMYRMGVISLVLGSIVTGDVDISRCVKMALVHDLPEAIVGDIVPGDCVSKTEKYALESKALNEIVSSLPPKVSSEIIELWKEYEEGETLESIYVKDIDKFEMIIQAYEYEASDTANLEEFFESTKDCFKSPQFIKLNLQLHEMRRKRANKE